MINNAFVRYLKDNPPRNLPKLNNFVSFLQRKTDDAVMRASHITPNGYGSRLLVDIIKLADLSLLLREDTDQYRQKEYLLSITKDLEKPIDVRQGKHTTTHLFIRSRQPCFELMTASRRQNPLVDIPFDLPYNHPRWSTIQPMRLVDMGTTDLRFQVYNDQLVYQHHGPTHAIYALDCLALVAKFIAYYKSQTMVSNLDQCLLDFVHQQIIVPSLLKDSLALWLRNIYRQQLLSASPLESHTSTIWDIVSIDTIGSDFNAAMIDINHLKTDLKNQSISNQTVMSSLILGVEGESFTTYYKNLYYTSTLPSEQPYVWVECLKNLSYCEFILMVSSFTPDYPDVISLQRDVVRDIRFWLMMKPWQEIHGSIPYKTMIRSRLEGMYTYLQGG